MGGKTYSQGLANSREIKFPQFLRRDKEFLVQITKAFIVFAWLSHGKSWFHFDKQSKT